LESPYLCVTKHKHMTQTTTIPVVKVNQDSVLSSDVFYGSFDTTVKGKRVTVGVSNFIKDITKTYKFRSAAKCKAGFVNINEFEDTPQGAICMWAKNALVNLQVLVEFESGVTQWHNVYTTKGGKWYSIDRGLLEVLTVGAMRQSFPDMCDMKLWEYVGAKTWADKAFVK
jgi:hypothetical protein